MAPADPDAAATTRRAYVRAYVALIALTALTTAAAYADLGAANTAVALCIAGAKAAVVALVFMHARAAGRVGAVFGALGVFWVAVLIGLTVAESASRGG